MSKTIDANDLALLEAIANKYGMTSVELGKTLVNQMKKRIERQFRVSENEFNIISEKAKSNGVSVQRFCETACLNYFNNNVVDEKFFGGFPDGERKNKRITVYFKNENDDNEVQEIADRYGLNVGTLMRYCALNF